MNGRGDGLSSHASAAAAIAICLALAVSAAVFRWRTVSTAPAASPAARPVLATAAPLSTPAARDDKAPSQPAAVKDLRAAFKAAVDYAAFADSVRGAAQAGDSSAQYYLAESLRYCQQNLSRFFMAGGKPARTLNEAQVRYAGRPAGYQEEIVEIHARCHAFLDDPERWTQLEEWRTWLDRASSEDYPLAQSKKAGLMHADALVAAVSSDPTVHSDPEAAATAQGLALEALKSRDPEVIWNMVNLVDDGQTSSDKAGVLPAAWQLLACERGYDCSAKAEWVRSACDYDPLCNPGDTGQQYLERHLGDNLDQAKQLAEEIGAALDREDWSKVRSYLGAS